MDISFVCDFLASVIRSDAGWCRSKVLLVAWFDGLASILSKVEEIGVWPDGLLDAFFCHDS